MVGRGGTPLPFVLPAKIFEMFSAFQSALKDVFLVTVQNEEELTCPIVATALGSFIFLLWLLVSVFHFQSALLFPKFNLICHTAFISLVLLKEEKSYLHLYLFIFIKIFLPFCASAIRSVSSTLLDKIFSH